ncbi:MAG: response regulator [Myxococcota bacterium]
MTTPELRGGGPSPSSAEERLQLLEETLAAGVFRIGARGAIHWDAGMCVLFEQAVPPADLTEWGTQLQASGAVALWAAIDEVARSGEGGRAFATVTAESGDTRVIEIHLRPQPKGEVVGVCADVTEREAALERYEEAQRLGRVGSWSLELSTGKVHWSRVLFDMLGHDPDRGAPVYDTATRDFDDDSEAVLREAIARCASDGAPYDLVLRTRHGFNGVRFMRARGRAKRDGRSHIVGLVGTARDITSEIERADSLSRVAMVVPGVLFRIALSPEGRLEMPYVSPGIEALYGLTPEEVYARPDVVMEAVHPDDRGAVGEAMAVSAERLSRFRQQYRIKARDREAYRPILATSIPERRADGGTQWFGYMHDVSEQVAFEAQLETARREAEAANRAKSDFLARMSHEIRTPMTAILGYLALVEGERMDPSMTIDVGEALATVRRNAEHLLQLINEVLDVSKIEAGEFQVERGTVDLGAVAREVCRLCEGQARMKGIELRSRVDASLPFAVTTDGYRVRQILLNLVGNAIKFTERGSVEVLVGYADGQVSLQVEDTGVGMTAEELERVSRCDAFHQADNSMARRYGGTGLGLHICRSLARLLGGDLAMESKRGRGTKVRVWLMAPAVAGVTSAPPPSAPGSAAPQRLAGRRVLVADDGVDNRRLIRFLLEREQAVVELASNGREAVAAATAGPPPDLILMDMAMPEMDGYEATRALVQTGLDTPIVALTAHAMSDDRQKCLDAGCRDYLSKPFAHGDLVELCAQWLRA